jgi:hypothetical protein
MSNQGSWNQTTIRSQQGNHNICNRGPNSSIARCMGPISNTCGTQPMVLVQIQPGFNQLILVLYLVMAATPETNIAPIGLLQVKLLMIICI